MTLCEMLETNYKDVLYMAKHLVKTGSNFHQRHTIDQKAKDLMAETLIYMNGKNPPNQDKEFRSWYYRCMYYVSLKPYLGYQKIHNPKEKPVDVIIEEIDYTDTTSEDIGKIYDEVKQVADSLTGVEKILFELIYTERLSYREIVYIYKSKTGHQLSLTSLKRMVKPMKEKLKAKWNI